MGIHLFLAGLSFGVGLGFAFWSVYIFWAQGKYRQVTNELIAAAENYKTETRELRRQLLKARVDVDTAIAERDREVRQNDRLRDAENVALQRFYLIMARAYIHAPNGRLVKARDWPPVPLTDADIRRIDSAARALEKARADGALARRAARSASK